MSSTWEDHEWRAATTQLDHTSFWKRHLRAQFRLFAGAAARDNATSRDYRTAIVWGAATFLSALQDCATIAALHERASDLAWWDHLCQTELGSLSLVELRIGATPISGKGLADSALALRSFELARRVAIDPTTVFTNPPLALQTWLRAEE